jgi:acylphosphatase
MMPKKKCFQFIVKDKVQDVGLRLAIAKLIPDELDVRADNLPDGSVRVVLRGYERDVMRFWEQLQKHILGKVQNPTFSNTEGITTMPIATDRFFHKLQCEQMEKFVGIGSELKGSIDGMSVKIDNMSSKLDSLPKNMAKEIIKLRKNGFF